jgi:hypothetical protein
MISFSPQMGKKDSRVIWEWDPRGFDPATGGTVDRPPGARKGTDHRTERNFFPTHLLDHRTSTWLLTRCKIDCFLGFEDFGSRSVRPSVRPSIGRRLRPRRFAEPVSLGFLDFELLLWRSRFVHSFMRFQASLALAVCSQFYAISSFSGARHLFTGFWISSFLWSPFFGHSLLPPFGPGSFSKGTQLNSRQLLLWISSSSSSSTSSVFGVVCSCCLGGSAD